MKTTLLFLSVFLSVNLFAQDSTFIDKRDGRIYKTVKIGEQEWMAENLAFVPDSGVFYYIDTNSFRYRDTTNLTKYGLMYDWETSKEVCPTGWHLPSNGEWSRLTKFLGGKEVAGLKMKSTYGWVDLGNGNGNGSNLSGFNALPGGRYHDGQHLDVGYYGRWWSRSKDGTRHTVPARDGKKRYYLYLYASSYILYCCDFNNKPTSSEFVRVRTYKRAGLFVRCIKD